MYRDLVVPITGTPGDAAAVACACGIAAQFEARLAVLVFTSLPLPLAGPWGDTEYGFAEFCERVRANVAAEAEGWRAKLAQASATLSWDVRVVDSLYPESPGLAALHARYADLVVMAAPADPATDAAPVRSFFAPLLLASGRPVLLAPPAPAWRTPRHAVVAWQPRREAARAVHDALPLLAAAGSVDLLTIGDDRDEPEPGADISAHLARHGLNVRDVARPCGSGSVAAAILAHARESGADLVVAGGYGHSRLREWALGGVTRELTSGSSPLPILFSH